MDERKPSHEKNDNNKSIEDVTIGQFFKVVDYFKQFWALIAIIASGLYFAFNYFATSKSVEKLSCQVERQSTIQYISSSITLLERQKEDLSTQKESLLNLENILLEIQITNDGVALDLSKLDAELDKLKADIDNKKKNKDGELRQAKSDLSSAQGMFKKCDGEKS
ncbi:MAG: hypothetical protein KYX63_05170 [Alteromonas macleodii]|nr:hypothetical protein [Alteromonas macleodii]